MFTDWVLWVSLISLSIVFIFAYTVDRPNPGIFRREVHHLRTIPTDKNKKNTPKFYIRR